DRPPGRRSHPHDGRAVVPGRVPARAADRPDRGTRNPPDRGRDRRVRDRRSVRGQPVTAGVPLWELPQDGRPCPFTAERHPFGSWQELRDHADAFDTALNVVIWWYWYPADDDQPTDELVL